MLCSRACVLLSPRNLVLSCSHGIMLSCSAAAMPSCSRASKLSYRKESGNALLFFLWLLVSSSLTPSPALSLSQAKEYAPSVTRFPFLLVQVSKIVLPSRPNAHFRKKKVSSYISFVRMSRTGASGHTILARMSCAGAFGHIILARMSRAGALGAIILV